MRMLKERRNDQQRVQWLGIYLESWHWDWPCREWACATWRKLSTLGGCGAGCSSTRDTSWGNAICSRCACLCVSDVGWIWAYVSLPLVYTLSCSSIAAYISSGKIFDRRALNQHESSASISSTRTIRLAYPSRQRRWHNEDRWWVWSIDSACRLLWSARLNWLRAPSRLYSCIPLHEKKKKEKKDTGAFR